MIYQGIDRSILEVDKDGDIKVYFSTEDKGIKLQDITSLMQKLCGFMIYIIVEYMPLTYGV